MTFLLFLNDIAGSEIILILAFVLLFFGLNKDEILANGVLFFLAGFDTVANSLSFLFYDLAVHPDCQEKVYEEVSELFAQKVNIINDQEKVIQIVETEIHQQPKKGHNNVSP